MSNIEELDAIVTALETSKPGSPTFSHKLVELSEWNRAYDPQVRRLPIEIEIFQREPNLKNRAVKVWLNGNLVYANDIATTQELRDWRDALDNELRWLKDYLVAEGFA